MLLLKAQEQNLSLHVSIQPDLPTAIYTDEGKLRQILINLIGNAIKFTQQGYIHVRVYTDKCEEISELATDVEEQNYLCFEVEDSGVGISEAEAKTLFQPFVQTDSGRRSQEGTGLGLSISYSYVKLMGGQMSVSSQLGVGSIFKFYIPLTIATESSYISPIASPNRIVKIEVKQPYRILIAEDMRLNRQLLNRILSPLELEVREVSNGQDAIAVWESWSPHLIWMDVRMPILNGYEATASIRKIEEKKNVSISQRVKIIALTASSINLKEGSLLCQGFDGFVTKPFTEEKICMKMSEHLDIKCIYSSEM
jgi:CheY-like chemotaxis protein